MTTLQEALDKCERVAIESGAHESYKAVGEAFSELRTALAQQGQEPVAWAIFTDEGNVRMWSTLQPHVQRLADAEGLTVIPLYTAAPQAQPVAHFVLSGGVYEQVAKEHAADEDVMPLFAGPHSTSGDYALGYAEGFNDACKQAQPVAQQVERTARDAFESFAKQYDTFGNKWQDMGADDYFIAGYKAALQSTQRELSDEQIIAIMESLGITVAGPASDAVIALTREVEAAHGIKKARGE